MKATVRQYGNTPTIFVDEERVPPLAFVINRGYVPRYPEALFRIPQLRILSFPCSLAEAWIDDGTTDFHGFDEAVHRVVERAPDCLIMIRINLEPPEWWEMTHPEELNRYAPGSTAETGHIFEQTFRRQVAPTETEHQSFASRPWRDEAGAVFRRLIRHVKDGKYADRMIGYHICAGWGNEWLYYGVFEGRFSDYSRPMVDAFREWLRERYGKDGGLQHAWADESVTLGTVEIPTPDRRKSAGLFSLKDLVQDRPVIDFLECQSDVMVDALLHFAAIVKNEAPDRLCAAYYGYLSYGGMFPYTMQHSGHRALQRVLASNHLDLLSAPYGYNDRQSGGDCTFMSVVESVRRHGKVWMNEDDTRVELGADEPPQFGGARDIEWAMHLHRRNAAASATKGIGLWWIDFGRGWYDHPRIVENLNACSRLIDRGNAGHYGPPCEVAVVLDDRSALHELLGDDLSKGTITRQISRELGRFGAPYDLLRLDDVEPDGCSYKLYIFLGVHSITAEQLERVHHTVRRSGVTSLWTYAPGIFGGSEEDRIDPARRISDVTGIQVGIERMATDLTVRITDLNHEITDSLSEPIRYGTDRAVGPIVYGCDPRARVLGEVHYLHTMVRPGFLVKKFEGFRSVYSSAFNLPAPLLRGIARWAGVHIYCETGDVLHAGRGIVALHAVFSGRKVLLLPRTATVKEFFGDETVTQNGKQIEFDLEAGRTAVFTIGG